MVSTAFREQAKNWEDIALSHMSSAIRTVHHFIREIFKAACPDKQIRTELWSFILEDLTSRYREAMEYARFLLRVEVDGKVVTCNPHFDYTLKKTQKSRLSKLFEVAGLNFEGTFVPPNRDDSSDVCEKIHDVLKSYYEVARSRFVDNICTYAVDHFLLSGEKSPLRVLSSERVMAMTAVQLDTVAGEDSASRSLRGDLEGRIATLEMSMRVLRG